MKKNEFQAIRSQLQRGQHVRLEAWHPDGRIVVVGKVYDSGPSFITLAIKGKGGGLKNFLVHRVESLEPISEEAA
jgi:hypothetical protein